MEWWQDLWLNEGFATFVGWLAVDHLFPTWDVWTKFTANDLQSALSLDGLRSSHPIEVPVRNAADINQIFDAISYSKGASVIRMLEGYVGREGFMKGVRIYLKRYAYGNTVTDQLWEALGEATGKDVGGMMKLWTRQTGYPLITVAESTPGTLSLSQSRYLSTGDVSPVDDTTEWFVPLGLISSTNLITPTADVLRTRTGEVRMAAPVDFYKLNGRQTAFYRVKYGVDQLAKLGRNVDKLDSSDRVGLVADAFALAEAGYGSTVGALELVKYYGREEDYTVLSEISARLGSITNTWYNEPDEVVSGLKTLALRVFSRHAKALGWDYPDSEKTNHLLSLKRTLCLGVAGRNGDPETVVEARSRFAKFVAGDTSALHPNIRGTAFVVVLQNSVDLEQAIKDFDAVFKIYKTSETVDGKLAALQALGATPYPELLDRLFELALNIEEVKPQDIIYPLVGIIRENKFPKSSRPRVWQWLKANWPTLIVRYKAGLGLLGNLLSIAVESAVSTTITDDLEAFVSGEGLSIEEKAKRVDETKGITMTVKQTVEKVKAKTKWLARDREAVAAWVHAEISKQV
ncbi:Aminopeptidase 2 mitochondrial [Gonapodya sp. JEL0774]|nr:Aminopeptidase 2 mitochondrial [Gonapodya sp. JEL0774]